MSGKQDDNCGVVQLIEDMFSLLMNQGSAYIFTMVAEFFLERRMNELLLIV
jgi:hypothetical protein